jgi:hypothetical protein
MKSCFILSIMLVVTILFANAQQDTSRTDTTEHIVVPKRPDPLPPVSGQPPVPPSDAYNSTDPLIRIRMDAIPSALKRTLEGEQYRGWESSTIYQNQKTYEYSIDIRSGDSLKTFRFDRVGNPLNPHTPSKDN